MNVRKTKVICTLGPAVDDEEMIRTLIRSVAQRSGKRVSVEIVD